MTRSLLPLTKSDLRRLGELASVDRESFFARNPATGSLYESRLFAVALCQGAALHFLDGKNGIKDLDVWSFYTENPARMFPPRRRAEVDFGDPRFGVSPGTTGYVGRKVDLIGRSIPDADPEEPVESLRRYLSGGKTKSARLLALKPVVLIEPAAMLGTTVWPR